MDTLDTVMMWVGYVLCDSFGLIVLYDTWCRFIYVFSEYLAEVRINAHLEGWRWLLTVRWHKILWQFLADFGKTYVDPVYDCVAFQGGTTSYEGTDAVWHHPTRPWNLGHIDWTGTEPSSFDEPNEEDA